MNNENEKRCTILYPKHFNALTSCFLDKIAYTRITFCGYYENF